MTERKIKNKGGKFDIAQILILFSILVFVISAIALEPAITGFAAGEDELVSIPISQPDIQPSGEDADLISIPEDSSRGEETSNDESIVTIPPEHANEIEQNNEEELIAISPEVNITNDAEELFGMAAVPTQSQPILNATSIYNFTTDNLTCYNQSTVDTDNNNITNIYNWYKNNLSIFQAYLPFDHDDSGGANITKDYSGGDNYWTLGAPTDGDNAEPTWTPSGKVGGAYEFDGSNDTIRCNGCASTASTSSLSVEAWIRANDTTIAAETIAERNCNWIWNVGTNKVYFQMTDGGGCFYHNIWYSSTTLTQGAWMHVVVTINSSDVSGRTKIYINGVPGTTLLGYHSGWTNTGSNGTTIGTRAIHPYVTQPWKGAMDEIHIYNYSLSSDQVYQRYLDTKNGYSSNQTIADDETGPGGENWTCEITPNDGIGDGTAKNSSILFIALQVAPNITLQELYPASPTTADNLTLNATCLDGEQTNLTAYWNVYKNNVNQTTLAGYVNVTNGTNTTVFTILSGNLSGGDLWKAKVWCYDSFEFSTQGDTSTRHVISSNAPVQTRPLLSSSSNFNLTTDNITCFNQSTSDADGDSVFNIYNWYRNSTPVMLLNLPFNSEYSGGANTSKDYSGNNFYGQLGSSVNGDTAEPVWTPSGKIGGAYEFDGADDYINFGQASLDIGRPVINYTLQINSTTPNLKFDAFGLLIKNDSNNALHFRRVAYNHTGTEGKLVMNTYNIANNSWGPMMDIYNDTNESISDANGAGGGIIGNNIYVFFTKQDFTKAGATVGIGYIKSTDLSGTSWSSYNELNVSPLTSYSPYGHIANTSNSSTYLQPFWDTDGTTFFVKTFKTTDSGQTWTVGPTIYEGADALSETSIEYIGNRKLIAHSRLNSGTILKQATSTDDGQTWSSFSTVNLGKLTGGVEKIPWLFYDSETGKIIELFMDRIDQTMKLSETDAAVAFANASNWEYGKAIYISNDILGYPSIIKTANNTYFYIFTSCPSETDCDTFGGYYISQPRVGLTASAWIKANLAEMDNKAGMVIAKSTGASAAYGFFMDFDDRDSVPSTNSITFTIIEGSGSICNLIANNTIPDSNWHHIAGVFNETNNSVALYEDGIFNTSIYCGKTLTDNALPIRLGATSSTASLFFNGTMDEVRLYNAPLSPSQIYQLYQDSKDGHSSNQTIVAEETDTVGENWTCEVTPNDLSQDGITYNSTMMLLANVTPEENVTLPSAAAIPGGGEGPSIGSAAPRTEYTSIYGGVEEAKAKLEEMVIPEEVKKTMGFVFPSVYLLTNMQDLAVLIVFMIVSAGLFAAYSRTTEYKIKRARVLTKVYRARNERISGVLEKHRKIYGKR